MRFFGSDWVWQSVGVGARLELRTLIFTDTIENMPCNCIAPCTVYSQSLKLGYEQCLSAHFLSKFLWRFVQNSFHFWKLRVKNSLHAFTFAVEKYCHSHPSGARIQFVGYFTQFVVMFIVWLAERKYSNMSKMSLNHCNSFFFELCVQCVCF